MTPDAAPGPARCRTPALWLLLISASALAGAGLWAAGFPAAFLMGPMLAALCFGVGGSGLKVPRLAFLGGQGVVGCIIARNLSPEVLPAIAADWPLLALAVVATMASSCLAGLIASRGGRIGLAAATWGAMPGMAAAMVIMAEERGVDARLVAFMQYVRLVTVIAAISLVFFLLGGHEGALIGASAPTGVETPWTTTLGSVLIAATGLVAYGARGLPTAGMIMPLVLGAALEGSGLFHIAMPLWLVGPAFAVIGAEVGLKFTRDYVTTLASALPMVLVAVAVMIVIGALVSLGLARLLDLDLLTAMLATTPGGIDSVVIVAVNSRADISFVLALQTLRLFVVIAAAPFVVGRLLATADWLSRRRRP